MEFESIISKALFALIIYFIFNGFRTQLLISKAWKIVEERKKEPNSRYKNWPTHLQLEELIYLADKDSEEMKIAQKIKKRQKPAKIALALVIVSFVILAVYQIMTR